MIETLFFKRILFTLNLGKVREKVFMSSRVAQGEQRKTADAVSERIDGNLLLLILPALDVPVLNQGHAMRGAHPR